MKKYVIGLYDGKMNIEIMIKYKNIEEALKAVIDKYDNKGIITFIYGEEDKENE